MKKVFGMLMLILLFVGVASSTTVTDVTQGSQIEFTLSHNTTIEVVSVELNKVSFMDVTTEVMLLEITTDNDKKGIGLIEITTDIQTNNKEVIAIPIKPDIDLKRETHFKTLLGNKTIIRPKVTQTDNVPIESILKSKIGTNLRVATNESLGNVRGTDNLGYYDDHPNK
jgi:anti-anti-sigma regulatory factor